MPQSLTPTSTPTSSTPSPSSGDPPAIASTQASEDQAADERAAKEPSENAAAEPPRRSLSNTAVTFLLFAALAVIALALYLFDPAESPITPPCAFHTLTGLHCPGCGGTRAVHSLLRGDVRQAAAWNVLALLMVPALAALGAYYLHRFITPGRTDTPPLSRRVLMILIVFFMLYWVARNLPFEPFRALAPHPLPRAESLHHPDDY